MLEEYILKVVLIGQSGVGKTSLLMQYTDGVFIEEHVVTIGVDFRMKQLIKDEYLATLQLWDTAGQDRFRSIVSSFYRGAMGLVVVFDVTDLDSFERVPYWIEEAGRYGDADCIKVLVGNKVDKVEERAVSKDKAQGLAQRLGMQYIETSAKDAHNVHAMFDAMADTIVKSKREFGYVGGAHLMTDSFRLESKEVTTGGSWCGDIGSGYCY
ncbi:WD40 repeat protein [Bulinus truncatus]|nr:WD40 repeat protein [Bulinus truncatus]